MSALLTLASLALTSAARLPADVVPQHYDLFFDVDPAGGSFRGTADIDVQVRAPVQEIFLHAADLSLSEVSVSQHGTTVQPVVTDHPDDEMISLAAPLRPGTAHLHLAFGAPLRHDLRGLYLAKTKSGEAWAATQFEPTDARKAFPCFDEPSFKATFTVRARVPAGLSAVSNGAVKLDRPEGAGHMLEFGTTPPISSYLVALAVGRFGMVEGQIQGKAGNIPIRVIAPQGQERLGRFALAAAEKVIPWYEQYTGMAYPFGKLDMVAIPEFEAGAMENVGAIFYRDLALLLDDASAPLWQQQEVEEVVAHEIAHQWFGDLVTMRWWDDLWLNEAFASLMEYRAVRDLRPDWPMRQQFTAQVAHAKLTDSLRGTHAIHAEVTDPAQANAQFDEITYIKGEGVLDMLAHFVGEDGWRAGLHRYLASHAYGNARAEDLWDAEAEASGKPLAAVAQSWIGQPGLPVVSLKSAGAKLRASQRRFTLSSTPDDGQRWQIPLCVETSAGEAPQCQVLGEATDLPPLQFANADGVGMYRTAYPQNLLTGLLAPLRGLALNPDERLTLLADERALSLSGAPLTPLLDELDALASDRDATVVSALTSLDRSLDQTIVADADQRHFRAWVQRQLGPIGAELGWDAKPNEGPDRAQERAVVLGALDEVAGDPTVATEAERRLAASEAGGPALEPTLRDAIFGIAARHGDQARWEDFKARMASADEPGLRMSYLLALSNFRDPQLIERTLELTTDGTIPMQNVAYTFRALLGTPDGRGPAWRFFKEHAEALRAKMPPLLLGRAFVPALGGFCSAAEHDDVAAFFKAHPAAGAERPLERALDLIDVCAKEKGRQQRELHKWLGGRGASMSQASSKQ